MNNVLLVLIGLVVLSAVLLKFYNTINIMADYEPYGGIDNDYE